MHQFIFESAPMQNFKNAAKRLLNSFGVEIRGHNPMSSPTLQLVATFERFGIDLVLDVGANRGQFGTQIRRAGYKGKIVSFEPLSQAAIRLERASRRDTNWVRHPRCALGDRDGQIDINIAGNSESSSILQMLPAHRDAAPQSAYCGQESVPIARLDTVVAEYLVGAQAPFLKIDAQGYEWQILDGAIQTMPKLRGMLLELSLVPLYEGQHLWLETITRLEQLGFQLWALHPAFTDPRDYRILQMDGIFYRKQSV
jgi:FkbM family methyltransferase